MYCIRKAIFPLRFYLISSHFFKRDVFLSSFGHLQMTVADRSPEVASEPPATYPVTMTPSRPIIGRIRAFHPRRNHGRSHAIWPSISATRSPHKFQNSLHDVWNGGASKTRFRNRIEIKRNNRTITPSVNNLKTMEFCV